MGTSASGKGPGSGVSLDPPWLDDIELPDAGDEKKDNNEKQKQKEPGKEQQLPKIAPAKRFLGARKNLGEFVRSGDRDSLRRAIGHYSRTGMGGAGSVANRMRTSTRTAVNLFRVLQSARANDNTSINEWVKSLSDRNASANDVINEIISKVAPKGGSLDETSCRDSMEKALNELLEKEPNVNLFNLSDDNIWMLIESFLGYEAFHRLCMDIGKVFESPIIHPREMIVRMNEMQEYLKSEIYVQVESERKNNSESGIEKLGDVLQRALRNTFAVYEEELK